MGRFYRLEKPGGRREPTGALDQLAAARVERGIKIDARTAATGWRGERMDYAIAVDALLYRAAHAPAAKSAI